VAKRRRIGWYSISLDTLRGWGVFLVVALLVAGAFFGYRFWESSAQQRRAAELIAEARGLIERLDGQEQLVEFENEYAAGKRLLGEAAAAYEAEDMAGAVDAGRRSRAYLAAILSYIERRGEGGEATFMSVQGGVEYRRGDGDWEQARRGTVLQSADHVRTSSGGSAEILFTDGTVYTLNPNSSIVVDKPRQGSGAEQAVKMAYGWLNLLTADRPSRVETPEAEARVGRDSEAFVSYEQGQGRYGAVSGEMEVRTGGGQQRSLGSLEEVTQTGDLLSEVGRLPSRPELSAPGNYREIDASRSREIELQWAPVPGADGYMLQVARNRLFVDNVIDDSGRGKSSARLGLRGEGTFHWRVAAQADGDGHGPWSAVRTFRVTSLTGDNEGDVEPPELHVDAIKRYGSIFIVEGRTEAGAAVEVNGEPVQVDADGSFTKPIQLTGEGYGFIVVRSRDAWDNVTERKRRVFTESP